MAAPWTTIGLASAPAGTNEVSAIAWTGTTNPVTAGTGIALTLQNIKATTIDTGVLTMTPNVGSTDIQWSNTCSGALTDAVAKKYFNCP